MAPDTQCDVEVTLNERNMKLAEVGDSISHWLNHRSPESVGGTVREVSIMIPEDMEPHTAPYGPGSHLENEYRARGTLDESVPLIVRGTGMAEIHVSNMTLSEHLSRWCRSSVRIPG